MSKYIDLTSCYEITKDNSITFKECVFTTYLKVFFIYFRPEKANALATAIETEKMKLNLEKMVPRLPDVDDTHFPLRISHVSLFSFKND